MRVNGEGMSEASGCSGQCSGCAYRSGADANQEPDNQLRGIFAALGGYAFVCHESLGWTHEREGYPKGQIENLAILTIRNTLVNAGASADKIQAQTADVRKDLRVCGGWKAAIRKLNAVGWFANKDVALVRRQFAKHAAACIDRLAHKDDESRIDFWVDGPVNAKREHEDIEEAVMWFLNEAKEARTDISWLFEGRETA